MHQQHPLQQRRQGFGAEGDECDVVFDNSECDLVGSDVVKCDINRSDVVEHIFIV